MSGTLPASAPVGRAARWPAGFLVAALVLHAFAKPPGALPEMLWACHVFTLAMAGGIALRRARLVGAAFLFHAAVGLPSFAADVVATGNLAPTSVLVHVLPIALGLSRLRRQALASLCPLQAFASYATLQAVSLLAPMELNVNLSRRPWAPMVDLFPSMTLFRVLHLLAVLLVLVAADKALRALLSLARAHDRPIARGP